MPLTHVRAPLLRAAQLRRFASVSTQLKPNTIKFNDARVSKAPNNVSVATIDDNTAMSYLTIAFRAGSRFESTENAGITHALRIGAALSTYNSTSDAVIKNIQLTGGSLDVFCDRELLEYRIQVRRSHLDSALKYAREIGTRQEFRFWDQALIKSRLVEETAHVPPAGRAIDLLHKAAYHRGLGNSIYCPKHNVEKFVIDAWMNNYVSSILSADRCTVVGYNINHDLLHDFATSFEIQAGGHVSDPQKSKYYGGQEIRDGNGLATVAVAVESTSIKNLKESLAFAILRYTALTDAFVEHSDGLTPLQKQLAKSMKYDFEFDMLNISYSDSGLFGFVLTADPEDAGKGITAAINALKSGSVSQGDVDQAKSTLLVAYLKHTDASTGRFESLHAQILRGGESGDITAAINSITVADVNAAAKKIATGKWSLGGVGNLRSVPHVSELN